MSFGNVYMARVGKVNMGQQVGGWEKMASCGRILLLVKKVMGGMQHMKDDEVKRLYATIKLLQSEDGCPWDKVQTHESVKAGCIEEACEVLAGINILSETGKADNLKEELGDLLLQVIFHACLAEKEGLFDLQDVARAAYEKMIRRHPHVFHEPMLGKDGNPVTDWEEIKKLEKAGREWEEDYLPDALKEGVSLIEQAARRKGLDMSSSGEF